MAASRLTRTMPSDHTRANAEAQSEQTDWASACQPPTLLRAVWLEGEAHVGVRKLARPVEPQLVGVVVLADPFAGRGLVGEVARQVDARDERLEPLGHQQALGTLALLPIVHDAALVALIGESLVARVVGRRANYDPPDLQVGERYQIGRHGSRGHRV